MTNNLVLDETTTKRGGRPLGPVVVIVGSVLAFAGLYLPWIALLARGRRR